MNQGTHECLGQNSNYSYLRVDGRTESFTSALDKSLSLPTYGWTNKPCPLVGRKTESVFRSILHCLAQCKMISKYKIFSNEIIFQK